MGNMLPWDAQSPASIRPKMVALVASHACRCFEHVSNRIMTEPTICPSYPKPEDIQRCKGRSLGPTN
eukprot:scaffold408_cov347-Pavlova_lutheri.AAC.7